jgi:hypothetical protein
MEIWKEIKGYPDYMISDLGRIKSLRFNKEKILKPAKNTCGYMCIVLSKDKKSSSKTIHQLVAIAFLNHIPCGLELVINHIDKNKLNNNLSNLEIITNRKNTEKNYPNPTSKYVGVGLHKGTNKWRARIRINNKEKHLGLFNTELEASKAYQNELSKL